MPERRHSLGQRLFMHDLRWIRENPEEFDRGLARRGLPARAAEVLGIDREWRALQTILCAGVECGAWKCGEAR